MIKFLIGSFLALFIVGCAGYVPAPQMAFKHTDGKYYCAAYTPSTQDPNSLEPIIFIYETTTLGCPEVTVDELLEQK